MTSHPGNHPAPVFSCCSVPFSAVFGHRFVLMDADRYVLSYLESLSHHIPEHTLSSLRQKFGVSKTSDQEEQHEGKKALFGCGLCNLQS